MTAIVRWAAWLPLIAIYGAVVTWLVGAPLTVGITVALKVALGALCLQPAIIALWLGRETSIICKWPAIFVVLFLLIIAACIFALIFAEAILETKFPLAMNAGLLAAIWIASKATQLFHRALYRGRCVDLLNRPQVG